MNLKKLKILFLLMLIFKVNVYAGISFENKQKCLNVINYIINHDSVLPIVKNKNKSKILLLKEILNKPLEDIQKDLHYLGGYHLHDRKKSLFISQMEENISHFIKTLRLEDVLNDENFKKLKVDIGIYPTGDFNFKLISNKKSKIYNYILLLLIEDFLSKNFDIQDFYLTFEKIKKLNLRNEISEIDLYKWLIGLFKYKNNKVQFLRQMQEMTTLEIFYNKKIIINTPDGKYPKLRYEIPNEVDIYKNGMKRVKGFDIEIYLQPLFNIDTSKKLNVEVKQLEEIPLYAINFKNPIKSTIEKIKARSNGFRTHTFNPLSQKMYTEIIINDSPTILAIQIPWIRKTKKIKTNKGWVLLSPKGTVYKYNEKNKEWILETEYNIFNNLAFSISKIKDVQNLSKIMITTYEGDVIATIFKNPDILLEEGIRPTMSSAVTEKSMNFMSNFSSINEIKNSEWLVYFYNYPDY